MGSNAGRLLRQMFGRKHNLGFECDLVMNMFTIKGLAHIPLFLSHTVPPGYVPIVE
jgi:hypothetical protein